MKKDIFLRMTSWDSSMSRYWWVTVAESKEREVTRRFEAFRVWIRVFVLEVFWKVVLEMEAAEDWMEKREVWEFSRVTLWEFRRLSEVIKMKSVMLGLVISLNVTLYKSSSEVIISMVLLSTVTSMMFEFEINTLEVKALMSLSCCCTILWFRISSVPNRTWNRNFEYEREVLSMLFKYCIKFVPMKHKFWHPVSSVSNSLAPIAIFPVIVVESITEVLLKPKISPMGFSRAKFCKMLDCVNSKYPSDTVDTTPYERAKLLVIVQFKQDNIDSSLILNTVAEIPELF